MLPHRLHALAAPDGRRRQLAPQQALLLLAAARLHHFRHELDLGVATVPLTADIVLDRRNGILHVDLDALLALNDLKRTVLTNQTIIHSLLVQLRRFPGKDGCHRIGIHIQ